VSFGDGQALHIDENTRIRDILIAHPEAVRVVVLFGVPVSCARRTVAQSARVAGVRPDRLVTAFRLAQEATMVGANGRALEPLPPTLNGKARDSLHRRPKLRRVE
jgi:hypothetical protein